MLTRLKVNGFKNLVDVDVRFGPFTCIAGVNAAGKSNLFDAIRFLSLLAEKPLVEAARAVRGSGNRSMDIRSLFTRIGDEYVDEMSFEAEMIVPATGIDDLGQPINAGSTFLRYCLTLRYLNNRIPLSIKREALDLVGSDEFLEHLRFPYGERWRQAAIQSDKGGGRRLFSVPGPVRQLQNNSPSTESEGTATLVPALLPRTLLSVAAANRDLVMEERSSRTDPATLVRQEMQSWRVFQLDPAKISESDNRFSQSEVGEDGSHVAATLYRLAHTLPVDGQDAYEAETAVYARVGNRLAQLVDDVWDVTVDLDEVREALTIQVTSRDGAKHSARALSDGTLRFLALAVLEQQESPGVYCIEEPENGIHPGRIPALLKLLQAIAMDTSYPIEPGNPLRQVIISTHSPSIVSRVPGDSLVVAELRNSQRDGKRFTRARFSGLANTWRDPEPGRHSLALGELLKYLNPEGYRPLPEPRDLDKPDEQRRILDRADVRDLLSPTPIDG